MKINASGIKNIRAMLKSQSGDTDSIYKKKTIINEHQGDTDRSLSFNVTPEEEDIKQNLLTLDIVEEGDFN
jgi:hypothetical protein